MKRILTSLLFILSFINGYAQEEYIIWTDFDNTTQEGNTLSKVSGSAGFNADARSEQEIPANTDGYVVYEVSSTDDSQMFGLTSEDPNTGGSIDFRMYFTYDPYDSRNYVQIRSKGTTVVSNSGRYYVGDKYRIRRSGSTIYFERKPSGMSDWTEIYSGSADLPSGSGQHPALFADCSIYYTGSTIKNAKIYVPVPEYDVAWTGLNNTTYDGNTLIKVSGGVGFNADARSEQEIPADSDGYVVYEVSSSDNSQMVGLTSENPNAGGSIDFRMYFTHNPTSASNYVQIRSKGTNVVSNSGRYYVGDKYRIRRGGSTIYFERKPNGVSDWTEIYSGSADLPSGSGQHPALFADCSIYYEGSTIKNTKISYVQIPQAPKGYYVFMKKMDGGYALVNDGILRVKVNVDYYSKAIPPAIRIYDKSNTQIYQVSSEVVNPGANYLDINLASAGGFVNGEFYTVTYGNQKGEIQFLRIKYGN